ncbi:MAG TPA: FKBP-type peptidyl-prolyl cis-trans isomerase [Candidatus Dormibacteraeota bacterium]|nr:FKBP-type peptidyl-prolyl cis-trans isomerase [Candidatus Dormibacteraeota bacterium]
MHITRKNFLTATGVAVAALVFGAVAVARQTSTTQHKPATASHHATAAHHAATHSDALSTTKQKESYALGMNIARGLKRDAVDIDRPALLEGIRDELGGKAQLTDEQAVAALKQLSAEVDAKDQQKAQVAAEANMKEGETFLAANKAKPGVVALPSGLQYKIEKAGMGPKPTAADTVVCNYRGTFLDGKEFDSSYKRGQPATFPVGGVIKGWTEALQLMPVGSKWQLFIPPQLAYGEKGAGGVIGPNQTLVFDVELLSIKGK